MATKRIEEMDGIRVVNTLLSYVATLVKEEEEKYTAQKGDVLVCEGGYPGRAALLPGGGFAFPFDLQAEIPLSLLDMIGMLTSSNTRSKSSSPS